MLPPSPYPRVVVVSVTRIDGFIGEMNGYILFLAPAEGVMRSAGYKKRHLEHRHTRHLSSCPERRRNQGS